MGGAVTLLVGIVVIERDHPVEMMIDIPDHGRIGIFIDGDGGGGMGNEEDDISIDNPGIPDDLVDRWGDINPLGALLGWNGKGLGENHGGLPIVKG